MGYMIDGRWHDVGLGMTVQDGHFVRAESLFRDVIDPASNARFTHRDGRYHLFVSYACPWAHRVLIVRALKNLETAFSVSRVHPHMGAHGWKFQDAPYDSQLFPVRYLHEVYQRADPQYTGRVTVPILWDKEHQTIVNNESSEIIRMLDRGWGKERNQFRPRHLESEIDELNARIYPHINNGVYKAGFATTQNAYDEAVDTLFETLDWLEEHLEGRLFLTGDQLTEADIRLFTTLIRFDCVYVVHFKCARRRIVDYPNLWRLTQRIYQLPGVRETVDFEDIRRHYFESHPNLNPSGIVAVQPHLDLEASLNTTTSPET